MITGYVGHCGIRSTINQKAKHISVKLMTNNEQNENVLPQSSGRPTFFSASILLLTKSRTLFHEKSQII